MKPQRINLALLEHRTGLTKYRDIDISNVLVHSGDTSVIAATMWHQESLIKDWIKERGEAQHESRLTLVSFHLSP